VNRSLVFPHFAGNFAPNQAQHGSIDDSKEDMVAPIRRSTGEENRGKTMKRIGILGLCLGALFALSLTASASAVVFPGLGRCFKNDPVKNPEEQQYSSASCTSKDPEHSEDDGDTSFDGGAELSNFKSTAGSTLLETVKGTKLTCTGGTSTGEFLGEADGRKTMTFTGCTTSGFQCSSAGEPEGTVRSALLKTTYGFITKKIVKGKVSAMVGVSLEGVASTTFTEFECAGLPVVIRGGVIGVIAPVNKMTTTFKAKFTGAKGEQKPDKFEGGSVDEKILDVSVGGGPFEEAGLVSAETITPEEKVELRDEEREGT
jgi:hypothetical protein